MAWAYLVWFSLQPVTWVLSSIHPWHARDDTVAIGEWEIEERDGGLDCNVEC